VGDPRSVGNRGQTLEENLEGEEGVRRLVSRAARLLKPLSTALDLGCGYGRVSDCFTGQGYDYLGVDVSAEATWQAEKRNPDASFLTADLATWRTERQWALVCALYVFVHFVDDVAWESIVRRAMTWVRPGGALLIADHFPVEHGRPSRHVATRPIAAYAAFAREHKLTLDTEFEAALAGSEPSRLPGAHQFKLLRKG
jgi:trans-aconitate methyltransferase